MTIEHDMQQRERALDATQSFIVQAPAGSGKTELLIQRFLTLLNHVKTPEEILAITFTKKAANEMRLRVIKALKHAQSEPEPTSLHGKKTWQLAKNVLDRDAKFKWHIIDNPNQLRILTIDALCSYLTKQLPLLSHFGAQPSIADNPFVLYREAVQEVLLQVEENNEWSQAIANLLLHLDNDLNKLHDLLIGLLAKREQWLPYIQFESSDHDIRSNLEQQLSLVIADHLRTLHEIFPREHAQEFLAIARFAASNLTLTQAEAELAACADLQALPDPIAHNKRVWRGLATLLLTKSHQFRKKVDANMGFPALTTLKNPSEKALHNEYRERFNLLLQHISANEELRLALAELFDLPDTKYADTQWEILQSLFRVLKVSAAQLRLTFQQYGQIDFIENAQAALAALGDVDNPTDLALALDYQIRHILIDEFQDTSFTQYQLLEKLTAGWEKEDGRTLFVVGDPMQSIYRFREAEVGLFIRMWKSGIGQVQLTPLVLSLNFRSTNEIVTWNNAHFTNIFPSFNDVATGAVKFSPSITQMAEAHEASTVDIKGFVSTTNAEQGQYIVELIQQIKALHPQDKTAILVRSRTHLADIIPALKQAQLAYRAVDIDPLVSRQVILDLLSLTCALLHPADRIAWLAVLRAPWCGLSLADLLMLAGKNPYAAISQQLDNQDVLAQLSPDGQSRVARVYPILKAKIADRERFDLRSWVESTWLLLGGPACLQHYAEVEDVNAYFKLLDEFSQSHRVINLEKLREKIEKLYANAQHDETGLQIMTIHTAKGLEFDTVILPHLESKMPYDDKALLQWMERPLANETTALLLAPIHAIGDDKDPIYEYISKQQRIKSNYETDRLLYVATTRAKKRLYLCFNATPKSETEYKNQSGSFLEKIWPLQEQNKEKIIVQQQTADDKEIAAETKPLTIKRLAAAWRNPITELSTANAAAHKKLTGFRLPDLLPKTIGTVTHLVLQQISQFGISWWETRTPPMQKQYLKYQFESHHTHRNQIDAAINYTLKAISKTLADERGRWILTPYQDAQSEYKITALINNKIESLVIDRTFIDTTGVRWIIDYKTANLATDNLELALDKEVEKYREQLAKYQEALRHMEDRTIRLGLYFPALPAWREI